MRGKVLRSCHEGGKPRDHPRLCGEKSRGRAAAFPIIGSPPPMRGKAGARRCALAGGGITPAYAGKRASVKTTRFTSKDHPRLCGEKAPADITEKAASRITPAYAGKSHAAAADLLLDQDHPRLCGEKWNLP